VQKTGSLYERRRVSFSCGFFRRWVRLATILGVAGVAILACTPSIGDKCSQSTDCSVNGDRLCDTSQPGGYCTVFNCRGDGCPDKAVCTLFNASVPGCAYNDYAGGGGSRDARSFCMERCFSQSDCRPGYVCADPRQGPWSAIILDDDQTQLACMVLPPTPDGGTPPPNPTAPVCGANWPTVSAVEAGAPSIADAGVVPPFLPDAGKDAGDAGDAGADAADGG
jgi:hypothetical protein